MAAISQQRELFCSGTSCLVKTNGARPISRASIGTLQVGDGNMRFRITRRDLIVVPGLALLLTAVQFGQSAAAASDPQEVVRSFYGVLLSNMRDGRVLGESGRLARLAPVVERTFDIPAMA